jgi:hypothetical protein
MRSIKQNSLIVLISAFFIFSSDVFAFPGREIQVPNNMWNCGLCHVSSGGGGARTSFGEDVKEFGVEGGNVVWVNLCNRDSDGDSFTNGQELGDPSCTWTFGDPNPAAMVTDPNDPESYPMDEVGGEMMPAAGEMMPEAGEMMPEAGEMMPAAGEMMPAAGGATTQTDMMTTSDSGCDTSNRNSRLPLLGLIFILSAFIRRRAFA